MATFALNNQVLSKSGQTIAIEQASKMDYLGQAIVKPLIGEPKTYDVFENGQGGTYALKSVSKETLSVELEKKDFKKMSKVEFVYLYSR